MRWSGGARILVHRIAHGARAPLELLTHTGKRFLHLTLVLLHRISGFPKFLFLL